MEQPIINYNIVDKNLKEETNVLTLCPIPGSINIDKIKEEITNYMAPRKPFYESTKRSPYIEDEFSEYFTAMSSGGYEIGRGHCGMDVKTKNNEGIDAMCVIMNGSMSNEKSIIQNFKSSGSNLDVLFKDKKDDEAVELFMNDYKNKLENVKDDKNLTDMYILAYISTNSDIYLACLKIDISRINYVSSGGFVEGKKKECVNIIVDNFIDSEIGKVNLYKSKKRVELRFKPEILQKKYVHKIYSM
jgi:hypothetical protein